MEFLPASERVVSIQQDYHELIPFKHDLSVHHLQMKDQRNGAEWTEGHRDGLEEYWGKMFPLTFC